MIGDRFHDHEHRHREDRSPGTQIQVHTNTPRSTTAACQGGSRSHVQADSTEPYAQPRCQTDGWRCGWVAQFGQSLRWR